MNDGRTMLADAIDLLTERYEFGFRGYGGAARLCFDGDKLVDELCLDGFPTIDSLGRATLEQLVNQHRWLSLTGSFRFEGARRLFDINLALYPTFDPERPVCLISHLDASLYKDLRDDDWHRLNHDAADRMRSLGISLGGHDLTDGFNAQNLESFHDVVTFDGAALKEALLHPASVRAAYKGGVITPGTICGIKKALLTLDQLRPIWGPAEYFETIRGHSILSSMIDYEFDDDDDDDAVS
ncbi:hypothetical protein DB30_05661 [Enhygromyxa salina]|uniref:Uncharacterized protein n=2 Tax=Enhygromyxa salina TaxID=215803 RepID=A0A0C1ZCB5_9BACT|nr:hypothetical protein DB30_05661 [Enhygromyxa salina]